MAIDLLPTAERPGWLSVSPLSSGPSLVVVVAGEADWETTPQLREQLIAALAYGPRSMVLDLADLTFCNVEGMRALLEVLDAAQRTGADVAIRGMSRSTSCLHRTVTAHRRTRCPRGRPWAEAFDAMFPSRTGEGMSSG